MACFLGRPTFLFLSVGLCCDRPDSDGRAFQRSAALGEKQRHDVQPRRQLEQGISRHLVQVQASPAASRLKRHLPQRVCPGPGARVTLYSTRVCRRRLGLFFGFCLVLAHAHCRRIPPPPFKPLNQQQYTPILDILGHRARRQTKGRRRHQCGTRRPQCGTTASSSSSFPPSPRCFVCCWLRLWQRISRTCTWAQRFKIR